MTKEEVIKRFCALASEVGPKLSSLHAHDCFCGENNLSGNDTFGGFQFSHEIMEFIEEAVRDALIMVDTSSKRPGHLKF